MDEQKRTQLLFRVQICHFARYTQNLIFSPEGKNVIFFFLKMFSLFNFNHNGTHCRETSLSSAADIRQFQALGRRSFPSKLKPLRWLSEPAILYSGYCSQMHYIASIYTLWQEFLLSLSIQIKPIIITALFIESLKSILLHIMFHELMARFQLELFIFITYFSTVIPIASCFFFPVGLSSLTRHFQQVLQFLLYPGLGRGNYKTC